MSTALVTAGESKAASGRRWRRKKGQNGLIFCVATAEVERAVHSHYFQQKLQLYRLVVAAQKNSD
jgi:hypothetical protein